MTDLPEPARPDSPELEECLEAGGLEGESAAAFERARRRIEKHHDRWRHDFPSYASLLDDDVQRAQALAGSYAAEARDTLEVWADARVDEAGGRIGSERMPELEDWMDRYARAWKAAVRDGIDLDPWEGPARERFRDVLDDIVAAGRAAAATRLEEAAATPAAGWRGWLGPLWRPLAALGRGVRAIFLPDEPGPG